VAFSVRNQFIIFAIDRFSSVLTASVKWQQTLWRAVLFDRECTRLIPCTLRQVIVKVTNACDTGLPLSIAKQAITPKQQAVPFNLASHAQ